MAAPEGRVQLLFLHQSHVLDKPDTPTPDTAVRDEIHQRLALLRRTTLEVFDIHRPDAMGERLEDWAQLRLETADIIVVLISEHLIDSELWDSHVRVALTRFELGMVKLIPVLVSEVNLDDSPFAGRAIFPGGRRSLETVASRGQAIRDIVAHVTQTVKELVVAQHTANHRCYPRRLLLAFANPRVPGQDANIGVGPERERIRAALAEASVDSGLMTSELWAADLPRLIEQIETFKPDLLHLGLHIDASGDILFQDLDHRPVPTSADSLWEAVSSCRYRPRVLMLNACHSATIALAAQGLFEHIIAMVGPVGDLGALDFSSGFYRALGEGDHVRTAYWEGVTHERRLARTRRCTPIYLHRPEEDSS
jgi:hypothetical protein